MGILHFMDNLILIWVFNHIINNQFISQLNIIHFQIILINKDIKWVTMIYFILLKQVNSHKIEITVQILNYQTQIILCKNLVVLQDKINKIMNILMKKIKPKEVHYQMDKLAKIAIINDLLVYLYYF